MSMSAKDVYELNYWLETNPEMHLSKYPLYLREWGYEQVDSILEIGCGPYGGFLPIIDAMRKVGVDPLIDEYRKAGIFRGNGEEYHSCRFEDFVTNEKFDAVLCADTLDHGDLDFSFIPQIAEFLKPGGLMYLHVHLRPARLMNPGHDHRLEESELDAVLGDLIEIKRKIFPRDIDGKYCAALVGVWKSP